jgi:hypothetical protein
VQKVKPVNSRVQKYNLTYGRVQKVKTANSRVKRPVQRSWIPQNSIKIFSTQSIPELEIPVPFPGM